MHFMHNEILKQRDINENFAAFFGIYQLEMLESVKSDQCSFVNAEMSCQLCSD